MNCLTDDNIKWIINHPITQLKFNDYFNKFSSDNNKNITKLEKNLGFDIKNFKQTLEMKMDLMGKEIENNLLTKIFMNDEINKLYEINKTKLKIELEKEGNIIMDNLLRNPDYYNIAETHLNELKEYIKKKSDNIIELNTEKMDKIIHLYDKTDDKFSSLQNKISSFQSELFILKFGIGFLFCGFLYLCFTSTNKEIIIEKVIEKTIKPDIGTPVLGIRY